MKSANLIMLLATGALLLSSVSPARAVVVGQWEYETSAGTPVAVGQGADGQQVDDTGGYASGPFHATGHGGTLSYRAGAVGSSHSLQFTEATSPYDYVDRAMPAAIANITQGAFTLETWFKTTDTGRGVLIGTFDNSADDVNFEVFNGNIRGHIRNASFAVTDLYSSGHASVADGQWHHAAFVRESALGTARLYLDGVQRGSATDLAGAFTLVRPKMYLGRDGRTDATRFNGYLDNTRISNAALTPEQFHISGDGEQNYYRMETDGALAVSAGQSASVVDDTGLHPFTHNGAAIPATAPSYSNDVAGRWIERDGALALNGYSLSFDGAGDYVELGDKPLLTTLPEDDFTLEFFLKTPSRNDRAILVGTYDGISQNVMNLEIGGAAHGTNKGHLRSYFQSGSNVTNLFGATDISDDEWHHVALVRSGAGTTSDLVQLFVDYELDGQLAVNTGQYTIGPDFFRLGRDSRGSGFYYQGLLDEFRISRTALDVDDFLRAVPEPGSFTLLVIAGVGLLLWRRRERIRLISFT